MTALTVGGANAGKIVHSDLPAYKFPVFRAYRGRPGQVSLTVAHMDPVEIETYYREELRGERECFYLYRHSSLSVDSMLQELILNYRPKG